MQSAYISTIPILSSVPHALFLQEHLEVDVDWHQNVRVPFLLGMCSVLMSTLYILIEVINVSLLLCSIYTGFCVR